MFTRNCVLLSTIIYNFYLIRGETTLETYCTINASYPFEHVSEKFLSISVDPSDLVGLDLSERSFLLAKHLGPAYIRIVGPSTKFVKFADGEKKLDYSLSSDGESIAVTRYMWFGVNEWLKLANLTPVFGISDAETTAGVWNPKSTLPLLEISDQMNVPCYWMLGFDSSNKNEAQYKKDLIIFQNVLAKFPKQKKSWKIVGSDISHRSRNEVTNILDDLKDTIAAVSWEWSDKSFPEEPLSKLIPQDKDKAVKIWMVAPKPSHSVSFYSALNWAEQVGKAAKMGYDVVFRQLGMREFFTDTPVYWFSLLHKKLMATGVFEVLTPTDHFGSSVYAHCTRKSHDLQEKGGLTVMVVNKNRQSYTVKIKWEFIGSSKTMEIHSYILTTLHENSTNVYLNGKLLTLELLEKDPFQPVFSISKSETYLSLKVPPLSIGFFVLPNARIPACVVEENGADAQENLSFSEEMDFTQQPRSSYNENSTFENVDEKLKKEIDSVEEFTAANYSVSKEAIKDISKSEESRERELLWKWEELQSQEKKVNLESRSCNLTSEELERAVEERARVKAAENNIVLTEDELAIIVEAVKRTILKYKSRADATENSGDEIRKADKEFQNGIKGRPIRKRRDVNKKLLKLRSHLEGHRRQFEDVKDEIVGNAHALKKNIHDRIRKLKHYRSKRDINMELLRLKTEGRNEEPRRVADKTRPKLHLKDQKKHEGTTRKLWQTSDELLSESEDEQSEERMIPKKKIFSKVAISDEDDDSDFLQPNKFKKLSLLDKLAKFGSTKSNKNKPTINYRKHKMDSEEIEDPITTSEEFNNIKEDLPCIHEYFGSQRENSGKMSHAGEVRRKLQKLNKGKGKMAKSSEVRALDSMEYLRRKRSCGDNVEYPNQELDQHGVHEEIVPSKNEVNTDGSINTMVGAMVPEKGFPDDDQIVSENGKMDKKSTEDNKLSLKVEEEAKKEIYMLKVLNERLIHKKKNIDEVLANQTLQKNLDEEENEIANIINQQDSSKVNEKLKEPVMGSREANGNQNFTNIDTEVKNVANKSNPASSYGVAKRSILDKEENAFGNYKSHTSNMKEWKPSDILSLRKPAEGVIMFSHLISRSKDTNRRRRRSENIDNQDNNIYLNGIEKGVLEMPEVLTENEDYKLRIPQWVVKNEHNDAAIESTTVLADTSAVQNIYILRIPQWIVKNEQNDTAIESTTVLPDTSTVQDVYKLRIPQWNVKIEQNDAAIKSTTVLAETVQESMLKENENHIKNETITFRNIPVIADEVPSNIPNIATSKEQSALDHFLNTVSSFFVNIGEVLGFKSKDN